MLSKQFVEDWIRDYIRDQNSERALVRDDYRILVHTSAEVVSVDFFTSVYVERTLPAGRIEVPINSVEGDFACEDQNLRTALNLPRTVEDCSIRMNPLTSLVGGPVKVFRMDCSGCAITSCVGAPECTVLDMSETQIVNFEGMHASTKEVIAWQCDQLASLQGLPTQLVDVDITFDTNLPLLRCLGAQHIHIRTEDGSVMEQPLTDILQKYAGQGRAGAIACAAELIRAGYKGNARW
jgi:hypothetical protein